MDATIVQNITNKLKELHLIDPLRKVVSQNTQKCTFSAHLADKTIQIDQKTLEFLTNDVILWIFLHEVGHLTLQQNGTNRGSLNFKIWIAAIPIVGIVTAILFSLFSMGISSLYYAITTIIYILVLILIFYIERTYYYQPYWDDEFNSDEYAVKGLFIINPKLDPTQIMELSFKSLDECRNNRRISLLKKYFFKITTKPHPPEKIRCERVKILYEIYKKQECYSLILQAIACVKAREINETNQ